MIENCRHKEHSFFPVVVLIVCLLFQNSSLCFSLNDEGFALLRFRDSVMDDPYGALSNWNDDVGVTDPCLWFGVECSGGKVVGLNLQNLCLRGTISPDLRNLVHIKSIILRNNSFSGTIPDIIGKLKELEVLDLGYNNFSGPLPPDLGNNLSLTILLLDNNKLFGSISPEILELKSSSEAQVDHNQLSNPAIEFCCNRRLIQRRVSQTRVNLGRKLLQTGFDPRGGPNFMLPSPPDVILPSPPDIILSPSPSPSPSPEPGISPSPAFSPAPTVESNQGSNTPPSTTLDSPPSRLNPPPSRTLPASSNNRPIVLTASIVGSALFVILVLGIFVWRCNKVATVKPWATGLSGQLQKAFVTGVPKLKRSELETACEDFSNVIGSSSIGTIYKGTLSSGVEIAVASVAAKSAKEWSKNLEAQFRKKIDTLSKVNHKNFVNLLGYCVDEEPFTRMIVFEYAPNGTLFEHLHIRESEHLDWATRMRIAMGMAYCLEHMHQLTPPIAHKNLDSSSITLTEDYAAKISDFCLRNESISVRTELNQESNIYSFGVILYEMITGRFPYTVDSDSLDDWASDYLKGDRHFNQMVDPTLKSFQPDQLEQIGGVIRSCVHPDPQRRLRMREVSARLREITAIGPDGAVPKISPLWWAELEIMSTEAA